MNKKIERTDPKKQKKRWIMQQNEDHTSFTYFDLEHYEKIQKKKMNVLICNNCNDDGCSICSPVSSINTLIVFMLCVCVASLIFIFILKYIVR